MKAFFHSSFRQHIVNTLRTSHDIPIIRTAHAVIHAFPYRAGPVEGAGDIGTVPRYKLRAIIG